MKSLEESIAAAMDVSEMELLPFLPNIQLPRKPGIMPLSRVLSG